MRKHIAFCLILFGYSAAQASAQWFSIGVKGGVALAGTGPGANESRRYLVGPSIEFRLPAGFAIEADAIYQRVGSSSSYTLLPPDGTSSMSVINRTRGNSWQFPILGKYYFGSQRSTWRPFVATGYAFSSTWFHQQGQVTTFSGTNLPPQIQPYTSDYRSITSVGAVFAAGVKYQKGRFAVLPEVRWTHWGQESYPLRRNTGSFLLGLRF